MQYNPKGSPSLLFSNQKDILLSLLGRLPTKCLDACRPAAAFVPLGIYGLLFLLLTSHPVATVALPSLCWPLFLALGGSKGPNDQEVCMQANFEGKIRPRGQMAGSNRSAEGGGQEEEGFLASRWGSQTSGTKSLSHLANEITKMRPALQGDLKQLLLPPTPDQNAFPVSYPHFLPRRMPNHTEAYPKYSISLSPSTRQHFATHPDSHSTGQSFVVHD